MKLASILTIFILLFIPFETASAKKPEKNEIRLTADQVAGANDIEKAILSATGGGKYAGTVILDGKNGPFVYSAPDKSLNIFSSSISLRGENQATINNCDDGLFFEGSAIHDILVENISFNCTGDGVEATGEFHDVTLQKNNIQATQNGILTRGASTGWKITENTIRAGWDGIRLTGVSNFEITKNEINAKNGIIVLTSQQSVVKSNTITAANQGILVGQAAGNNIIQANHISGVSLSGIALEPNVKDNRILSNKVTCASGIACQAVDASALAVNGNKISGNSSRGH